MAPKTILVYYPPNKRSVAIETLCKTIHDAGHTVIVLTVTARGPFHEELEKKGITTFSHVIARKSPIYFLKHARFLARFSKKNRVDMVWSHLQEGNIIAVLAQRFLKARVITFRHHAESAFYAEFGERFGVRRNRREITLDRIINRFARTIVVPSSGVWYSMEKYEHCNMSKVILLPYIYDFSSYPKPDMTNVASLREQYNCDLLLIMVSRLVPSKQHKPVYQVLSKLIKEGLSIKMIVMDDGDLRAELQEFIESNDLLNHIFMIGFKQDFVNYMMASDLLMHPSVTEASNNVVKEMGLLEKAVAVCRNVGDFSDYIEENKNGFFLESNDLPTTVEDVIRRAYSDKDKLHALGQALKCDVLKNFSDSPENKHRVLKLLE